MRYLLFAIFPLIASALGPPPVYPGDIITPAADSALSNILVGSGVTPDGKISYTHDIYLIKSDGSAPKRLTTFDSSNQLPGATAVAISPDGAHAAYLAILNSGGQRSEQVHTIDPITGTDRLIYTQTKACAQTPCLLGLSFSRDGTQVIWVSVTDASILIANYDGSNLRQLATGYTGSNDTTNTGLLLFDDIDGINSIHLDGSGLTVLQRASVGESLGAIISADGSVIVSQSCFGSSTGPQNGCTLSGSGGKILDQSKPGGFQLESVSDNGSAVAWLSSGALKINGQQIIASGVFDALLSGDGTRMVYTSGLSRRGAVWISDSTGANARPLFAPRTIYDSGITGLSTGSTVQLLSPGSYFSIYGTNFETASPLIAASTLPLPTSLGGVSITVNGIPVPIQAVTEWQINALLPQSATNGIALLTVQFADGFSISALPTISATAPALFTYSTGQAGVFHGATGTLVDSSHPTQAGEVLASYGFGLGVTSPGVPDGQPAPTSPLSRTVATPTVLVGGTSAAITYSGLVPGLAGLYQVNFTMPKISPSGGVTVTWQTPESTTGPSGVIFTQ